MPLNNNALFIANYVAVAKNIQSRCVKYGASAYSQPYRNKGYSGKGAYLGHEAYDCASFVWFALKGAGFPLGDGWPFVANKPSMTSYLKPSLGWNIYKFDASKIKKGDILLRDYKHTEIALSNTKSIGAVGSSVGILTDRAIGTNWTFYIRYEGDGNYTPKEPIDITEKQYNWIEKVGQSVQSLSKADMENNAICFYITAKSYGWSDVSIAAVLGNMEIESTINPGAQNYAEMNGSRPNDYGIGLIQWTGSRHGKMVDWVKSNYNYWYSGEGQTAYLRKELSETRWTVGNGILASMLPEEYRFNNGIDAMTCNTWTLEQATAWFFQCVEYVAIIKNNTTWNAHFPNRYKNAQKWYTFITGLDIDDIIIGSSSSKKEHHMPLWMMVKRKRPKIYIYN